MTREEVIAILREELAINPPSPWLDPARAAEYISSTVGSMRTWRSNRTGPKFHRVGGSRTLIRYHREELDEFMRGDA